MHFFDLRVLFISFYSCNFVWLFHIFIFLSLRFLLPFASRSFTGHLIWDLYRRHLYACRHLVGVARYSHPWWTRSSGVSIPSPSASDWSRWWWQSSSNYFFGVVRVWCVFEWWSTDSGAARQVVGFRIHSNAGLFFDFVIPLHIFVPQSLCLVFPFACFLFDDWFILSFFLFTVAFFLQVASSAASVARLTVAESSCYSLGGRSTYLASAEGLMTVFIDNTERSPTFRLLPLDTVKLTERQCWLQVIWFSFVRIPHSCLNLFTCHVSVCYNHSSFSLCSSLFLSLYFSYANSVQVWTPSSSAEDSWRSFLGRPFLGLPREMYQQPFEEQISDPYLRRAALNSLNNAGSVQCANVTCYSCMHLLFNK